MNALKNGVLPLWFLIAFLFSPSEIPAATRHVWLDSPDPVSPYTNWATAARTIQEAVDAAAAGDTVLVTNGVYASGGRAVYGTMTNRMVIDKAVTVQSVNGPAVTLILGAAGAGGTNGDGAIRCAYVGTNAVLSGFTLTNGHTRAAGDYLNEQNGGGAWCEVSGVLSNCVLNGNSARNYGGGAYRGSLNNCVLTNNSAICGGGAHSGTLTNCVLTGNSARDDGGGAYSGTLDNCILTGNSARDDGGGAYHGTLNHCTLSGNSASDRGGGALYATLNHSVLTGNSAGSYGGGAFLGALNHCTVTENSASRDGGGVYSGTLSNCTLSGNWAKERGGGVCASTLRNCTLTGNSAYDGGGTYEGTLNNCTLTGNSAGWSGGGAALGTLNNCIVYFNTAFIGPNYHFSTFNYSCTMPLPDGPENIGDDPVLASTTHLTANSPCLGRGSPSYSTGVDIDGEPWLNPPAMGADQYVPNQATGSVSVMIAASYTNVPAGYGVPLVAQNRGPIAASVWDFGDGVVVSNRAYVSHAWAAPGRYTVRLTGYNDSFPAGVSTTALAEVVSRPVGYVDSSNPAPTFPYASWATAARTIQEAIDAGIAPGRLVLVTNGIYDVGGRAVAGTMTNRVVLTNGVVVQSVNGPAATWIVGKAGAGGGNGEGAIRCAYVGANAVLVGFTLTNGHTRATGDHLKDQSGGGVWSEASGVLSNCVLTGNSAYLGGGARSGTLNHCTLTGNQAAFGGGGAYWSTLNNCVLIGNSAIDRGGGGYYATLNNCALLRNQASFGGGGAFDSTLYHCTLTGNSAGWSGGGAYSGTLNNCIVYYNAAPAGPNYYLSAFGYSCTTPLPSGPGNMAEEPRFVNTNGWGNLRLESNSPCINGGNNAYAPSGPDLDGRPRIVGGRVDMGAYEFQGAGLGEFIAWQQQFGLPMDGSADYGDPDRDGLHNWAEWRSGTDPTNALSALSLRWPERAASSVTLWWTGVSDRNYRLEWSTNLSATPPFQPLATNLAGQTGAMSYSDTNAVGRAPRFYRLGVE